MISPSLGIYFWMIRAACPMVSRQLLESYIGQGGVVGLVLYMHIAQCAVHEGKHMSALQDTYTLRWTAKTATPIYVGHGCILVIRCTVRAAGCRLEDVTVSRVSAKYDMLQPTRGPLEWCQTSTSIHSNHDCLPIQGRFPLYIYIYIYIYMPCTLGASTIGISTATCENSFSTLTHIIHPRRRAMTQDRKLS